MQEDSSYGWDNIARKKAKSKRSRKVKHQTFAEDTQGVQLRDLNAHLGSAEDPTVDHILTDTGSTNPQGIERKGKGISFKLGSKFSWYYSYN